MVAEVIEGFQEFERKLKELELTVQRKLLIEAAKAGGQIVLDAAKANAPRDTGALAEGMTMRVSNKQSDIHEATVEVGPSKAQWYGLFAEGGTVHHRAQPFLKPALESNRERITKAIKEKLLEAIQRIATSH